MGLRVLFEFGETINKRGSRDGVATDSDTCADTDALLLQFIKRLIGKSSRTRNNADIGSLHRGELSDLASRNADVALTWTDDSRAVGAEQTSARKIALQSVEHARFILGWNALSDAHNESHTRHSGFENCCGRCLWWHGDERRVSTGCLHCIGDRIKHGNAFNVLAALAWCYTTNDLRSVSAITQAMKFALSSGQTLNNDLGVFVNKNCHVECSLLLRQLDSCFSGFEHGWFACQF